MVPAYHPIPPGDLEDAAVEGPSQACHQDPRAYHCIVRIAAHHCRRRAAGGDLEDALDEGAANVGHERARFCWMSGARL